MVYINLGISVEKGTVVEEILDKKPKANKLTAIMPDADGRVWFTSKFGVVGVIDSLGEMSEDGCPPDLRGGDPALRTRGKDPAARRPAARRRRGVLREGEEARQEQRHRRTSRASGRVPQDVPGQVRLRRADSELVFGGAGWCLHRVERGPLQASLQRRDEKDRARPQVARDLRKGDLVYDNDPRSSPGTSTTEAVRRRRSSGIDSWRSSTTAPSRST